MEPKWYGSSEDNEHVLFFLLRLVVVEMAIVREVLQMQLGFESPPPPNTITTTTTMIPLMPQAPVSNRAKQDAPKLDRNEAIERLSRLRSGYSAIQADKGKQNKKEQLEPWQQLLKDPLHREQ
ncbi:hypothetical protein NQZ68_000669 [Dissostichus eleginoides]|nr:hypothetical protein NQZ68_000669 [Dissostichus eleginoides]